MTRLRRLQQRFQAYLINGRAEIEQDIRSTPDALAEHRLGTYYNAYRIRLIDCLAVDYSALQKYLGRESFELLALDYLEHYPSQNPSVRWFGQHLAEYLQRHYAGENTEFLQELASYEWAQTQIFDAANGGRLLQLEDMATVPATAWPDLTFNFKPAICWLDLVWNVPVVENALDNDLEPPACERLGHPVRWLLWRQDMKIHWRSLEVSEAWAIEQAMRGACFAEICEGLLEWVDEQQVAITAAGFLKQWVNDQLVRSIGNL